MGFVSLHVYISIQYSHWIRLSWYEIPCEPFAYLFGIVHPSMIGPSITRIAVIRHGWMSVFCNNQTVCQIPDILRVPQNTHNRHPIAHPRAMGCLLWVQCLACLLPLPLQRCRQTRLIFDRWVNSYKRACYFIVFMQGQLYCFPFISSHGNLLASRKLPVHDLPLSCDGLTKMADTDPGHVLFKPERCMMTSSNGNIFRITGHSCGESTGPRWIPRTKASDAELWCFLWSAPE